MPRKGKRVKRSGKAWGWIPAGVRVAVKQGKEWVWGHVAHMAEPERSCLICMGGERWEGWIWLDAGNRSDLVHVQGAKIAEV